jgi:hypothetical protein
MVPVITGEGKGVALGPPNVHGDTFAGFKGRSPFLPPHGTTPMATMPEVKTSDSPPD